MKRILLIIFLMMVGCASTRAQQVTFTPTCAGVNDTAAFQTIITGAAGNPRSIRIPYKRDINQRCKSSTLIIPSNITLDNTDGSGIWVITGQTLTMQGPVVNPSGKQLFYNALEGQGTVSFSGNTVLREVFPQWWGLVHGASSVNSPALQATVDAMKTTRRVKMLWTSGLLAQTTVPLRVWTGIELTFAHVSPAGDLNDSDTGIDYRGPDGTAAVQFYNTRGSTWDGINIKINADGKTAQVGIDNDKFNDGTVIDGFTIAGQSNTANTFKRFLVLTESNGVNTAGVRIAYTSSSNVENTTVDKVRVIINGTGWNDPANVNRGTAFKVGGGGGGANAKNTRFLSPQWQMASYGIESSGGASISVFEGESDLATIDFKNSGVLSVIRFRSENGRQFFSGSGASITLITNEIAGGGWDAAYPVVYLPGPTSSIQMIGNVFDTQAGITSVGADTNQNIQFFGANNQWADVTALDPANFSRGFISIGHKDKLGLYLGGKQYGNAIQFGALQVFNELNNVQHGEGSFTFAVNALSNTKTGLGSGDGSLVIRQGSAWKALTPVYRGTETMPGAATLTVTFSTAFPAANYNVVVTPNVNETFWVTNKTTTTFVINSSNAASTAAVDWQLTR